MKTQKLKELAQLATPSPWKWFTSNSHNRLSSVPSGKDGDVISAFRATDGVACVSISQDDMAFIEAAHPGAVIELIEQLEAADKDGREYAILAGTNAARAEKAELECDYLKLNQELNLKIKQEMHERFIRAEAEIARLDKESQRLSDQLGACDRQRLDWLKRALTAEAEIARRDAAARDPFGYMRVVSGLSFQIMEGAARPPDRSGDSVGPWFPIWTTTPQSASVPDGWKLVPIKPTEDMVISGFESKPDEHFSEPGEWDAFEAMSGCKQAAHKARLCYAAMLAAAPAPGSDDKPQEEI